MMFSSRSQPEILLVFMTNRFTGNTPSRSKLTRPKVLMSLTGQCLGSHKPLGATLGFVCFVVFMHLTMQCSTSTSLVHFEFRISLQLWILWRLWFKMFQRMWYSHTGWYHELLWLICANHHALTKASNCIWHLYHQHSLSNLSGVLLRFYLPYTIRIRHIDKNE